VLGGRQWQAGGSVHTELGEVYGQLTRGPVKVVSSQQKPGD